MDELARGALDAVLLALPIEESDIETLTLFTDPFLLAASGDHRYEGIAAMLSVPVGTVKWRISEARRLIRMKLDRLGHGDPR